MNNKLKFFIIYIILVFNLSSNSLANISSKFVNDIATKATDILSSKDTKELKMMAVKFSLTDIVEIVHKFTKINKNKIYKWLLKLKK